MNHLEEPKEIKKEKRWKLSVDTEPDSEESFNTVNNANKHKLQSSSFKK